MVLNNTFLSINPFIWLLTQPAFWLLALIFLVLIILDRITNKFYVAQENDDRETLIRSYVSDFIDYNKTIATMESCTSGFIASKLTDVEGASKVFKGGFVTYSNEAKIKNGVPKDVIEKYGVYSSATAAEMAKACKEFYGTDYGIGVTGTLGNIDPNNEDSQIGNIYIAIDTPKEVKNYLHQIDAKNMTRKRCKEEIVKFVFDKLLEIVEEEFDDNDEDFEFIDEERKEITFDEVKKYF